MDTTLGQRAQEQTFGQLGMGAAFMSEDAISGVMGVQRQILQLQDQARLKTEKVQVERYPSKATQSVRDATEFGRSVVELIALQTMSNETLNRIGGAIDSVRDFFSRNPFSPGNH